MRKNYFAKLMNDMKNVFSIEVGLLTDRLSGRKQLVTVDESW